MRLEMTAASITGSKRGGRMIGVPGSSTGLSSGMFSRSAMKSRLESY